MSNNDNDQGTSTVPGTALPTLYVVSCHLPNNPYFKENKARCDYGICQGPEPENSKT